jgi:hypothetical protein
MESETAASYTVEPMVKGSARSGWRWALSHMRLLGDRSDQGFDQRDEAAPLPVGRRSCWEADEQDSSRRFRRQRPFHKIGESITYTVHGPVSIPTDGPSGRRPVDEYVPSRGYVYGDRPGGTSRYPTPLGPACRRPGTRPAASSARRSPAPARRFHLARLWLSGDARVTTGNEDGGQWSAVPDEAVGRVAGEDALLQDPWPPRG